MERDDADWQYTEELVRGGLHIGPIEVTDEMIRRGAWALLADEYYGEGPSSYKDAETVLRAALGANS